VARRAAPAVDLAFLRGEARRYLERYWPSAGRLRAVLMRRVDRAAAEGRLDRDAGAALVDRVVAELVEAGALDDARWARAWVEDLHRRGKSRAAIGHALRDKGASPAVAEAALSGVLGGGAEAELEAARTWARKKRIGAWRTDPALRREKRPRDLAALARAGFPLGIALRVVDEG
jgi:regulatory protein